ncbi:hypothetical protein GIB67_038263 [Kingdonia uniflora]|uniref:Uncharacterized protein n=1 Tax=Kingdonia uniflora TaxID=39325 RepID=A0A7J7MSB7_9MAGN|nr:hypothetical protein GIB67_038263 [Kingdonia uniflora]
MPGCFNSSSKSPTIQSPHSHSQPSTTSQDTPRSSAQLSPTVNLSREYTLAVQTHSYDEIWSKIHFHDTNTASTSHLVAEVLHPNRQLVTEALRDSKPNSLTSLVSAYFDNSEETSRLCSLLLRSINNARLLYRHIHDILDVLPVDSHLIESQCDRVIDIFVHFDVSHNPFPHPESDNFNQMRECFVELKHQLNTHLSKARRRALLHNRATMGSAVCLIGTTLTLALSAVAIATHALVTLVAGSIFAFVPCSLCPLRHLDHVAELDAAAKGTYVLNNDLDTIDRLVARLHAAVESDKVLIQLGLERGRDRYLIQGVLKQLRKNRLNFDHQLQDLEEHVCLCFATINRTRSLLLQEIHLHQIHTPQEHLKA